jgi:formylglycine-generating enzyme required for sulfatase activity
MSHVFISYSKKDREYALSLAEELERRGFAAWIDERIDYGDDWELTIFDEIDKCAAFLVVMTPESYRSRWVRRECQHAEEQNKQPFPVLLKGDKFPRYNLTQYADVRGGKLPSDDFYERLAKFAPRKAEIDSEPNHLYVTKSSENITGSSLQFSKSIPQLPSDMSEVLPQPFDWCYVHSGKVTVEFSDTEKQEFDVSTFYIAKYPVTNAQFAKFIEAGGYTNSDYWTQRGWWYRNNESWLEPRFWRYSKWNGADCPVVGISWYEAWAFCYWLREVVHQTTITLPSEQQWQRAAQGDDGRIYAWGNRFDHAYCNTSESKIDKTTSVKQYPNGISPFGSLDMSGNVWEWCNDRWYPANRHDEKRVVARGGAFANPQDDAKVTFRFNPKPEDCSVAQGFRIVWAVE